MTERGRIMHQCHVLVLQSFRQNSVQILCGSNEIGEDRHQSKHCMFINFAEKL